MTFLYTATRRYDKTYEENGFFWDNYIEWSKLTQLTEVVSLDGFLNPKIIEPSYNNTEYWNFIYITGNRKTGFFTTLDYVLRNIELKEQFNLLAVIVEPTQDCRTVELSDFEFVGYDLLDKEYGTSALTNLGGLNETFLTSDQNQFGLIDDYEKAYHVKSALWKNNPEVYHADTNVIAVWRHRKIGR